METGALRNRNSSAKSVPRSTDDTSESANVHPVMNRPSSRKIHAPYIVFAVAFVVVLVVSFIYLSNSGGAGHVSDQLSDMASYMSPSAEDSGGLVPVDCQNSQVAAENEMSCTLQRLSEAQRQIELLQRQIDALHHRQPRVFPTVKFRGYNNRKRILVTGGAGFVGSHLVDRLMLDGHEVTVLDNLYTGRKRNVEQWLGHENFELQIHDVVNNFYAEVDEIYHLASPASPPHYMANPVRTIKTNTVGTVNMLGLAKRVGARILIASTSEVYGDPEVHPQPESYWGHVNPIGPRACYDEGKRVAETLAFAYNSYHNVSVRVARIFNTYGPRMHNNDGRVVSNFILQALQNASLTVYGSGEQTRSFQYVSDLVEGLVALMNSDNSGPVNLGNPVEHTIKEFAEIIRQRVGGSSAIQYLDAVVDDPQKRKPDISLARQLLSWQPKVSLSEGIAKTVDYFRQELKRHSHHERNLFDPLTDWSHIAKNQPDLPQIDGA